MSEPETIEPEVEEIMDSLSEPGGLPAVRETAAVNLFGDASPVTVVERATEAANALSAVIESKELFKQIGKKKHVYVEGWTLLGSMLGVFPVVEWTREIEGGWEARVVARTRNGDEVGAAEAMCTRRESTWKDRDDYALRSMAQTRAVSKALRHPLGFVMTLAGYEATPEAEMPREPGETSRVEGPEPLRAPTSWAKITEMVGAYDEGTYKLFMRFGEAARRLRYPGSVDTKSLAPEEQKELGRLTGLAALALRNAVDSVKFPPPTEEDIRAAWASVLEGQELQPAPVEEGEEE
jgi:hypothetical protein